MSIVKLTVDKSKSSKNGGFVLTLKELGTSMAKSTPFGDTKTNPVKATYYMKTDTAPAVGFEAEIDLDDYDIIERPFTPEDSDTEITLKWLHIK